MARDAVREMAERVSNWGRWGSDDEIGTLNYITPEKIVRAAGLVRKGKVFGLAIPFDQNGPQTGPGRRFNPIHVMIADGANVVAGVHGTGEFGYADDMITMPLQCATQWDSLAHVFLDARMYNDRSAALVTNHGAAKNSIDKIRDRVVTRGVLLDAARMKGVDCLEPGHAITVADLEAAAAAARVKIESGDLLLVRTGHTGRCMARKSWAGYASGGGVPGLSFHTLPWLHEKQVAGVATDTFMVEVDPSDLEGRRGPFHMVAIPAMGLLLGEIFDLEALAADCADDGVYEFLFVAPPLPVTGAVGSPINPYAVK
ncbi:MAG TPA: cyclase family protein [Candidatus Bathyarchaeia archaeon]|nr:cyclase family protein [Candidatus Bathyarchaeia archaeon]